MCSRKLIRGHLEHVRVEIKGAASLQSSAGQEEEDEARRRGVEAVNKGWSIERPGLGVIGVRTLGCVRDFDTYKYCVYSQDTVNQSPSDQQVPEGQSFQIKCKYTTNSFYAMQWYQQNRNGGLKYINKATSSRTYGDDADKFKPTVDTSSKSGSLTIKPSLSDSGTYYCAIEPHIATKNTSA
ncbi:TVA21 protein, partial [Polypterus senegalus]